MVNIIMTYFYKTRFVASVEDDSLACLWNGLVEQVQVWVKKKYNKTIVTNREKFIKGDAFGDSNWLFIETVSHANGMEEWDRYWACRIMEPIQKRYGFASRRWITEIGYQPISQTEADISYSVQYEDLKDDARTEMRRSQPRPQFNLPHVASYLLASDRWKCASNGMLLNTANSHTVDIDGILFGVEQCRTLEDDTALVPDPKCSLNKRWISLCRVNRPDRNNDIWMRRLADSVGGILIAPIIDEQKEQIFDNRSFIFHTDGPEIPDSLGFWEWSERQGESGRWYSDSHFIEQETPVEIYTIEEQSTIEGVIEVLKSGIQLPAYLYGQILFSAKNSTVLHGVLCNLTDFNIQNGKDGFYALKDSIYSLPYYQISENDVFTWKKRKIYKKISLGDSTERIPVTDLSDAIKEMFLQRIQWPFFKAQGISRGDWQKVKQIIHEIPTSPIIEKLSTAYSLSTDEAYEFVNRFIQNIDKYLNVEDVDSALIVQILNNHVGLKRELDIISEQHWRQEHEQEIRMANEEIASMHTVADCQIENARHQLAEIQESISIAQEQHHAVLEEIGKAQTELDILLTDIQKNEAIGNDTVAAVREKISNAQKDMAGFIADMSIFLPQPEEVLSKGIGIKPWKYERAFNDKYVEDDIEYVYTWNDEFGFFSQNLAQSLNIEPEFNAMLSAFLYSAHVNQVPILVAGPGGADIANALSASIYAREAGRLTLGNEFDYDIDNGLKSYNEQVISVSNMFGKGWSDDLPEKLSHLGRQIIWLHSTAEDLLIEPRGLYNFMLPILSESFIGMLPSKPIWPGKRSESNFKEYHSQPIKSLSISAIKKLGLSKLLLNRLTVVLSDAKTILNNPSIDKDLELLLGLLPLCVLLGRQEILKDVLESEKGLSSAVKAEAKRYIEEE